MPIDAAAELARARSDAHFVGWAISQWCDRRKRKRADAARYLSIEPDALAGLELRLLPRPGAFARDLARLLRDYPCNRRHLRALCRAALAESASDVAAAAEVIGVTARRVYQLRGVRRPKPRVTDADRAVIAGHLAAGRSRRQVAKLTGRSRKVVAAVAVATPRNLDKT